jgi:plastocyanin
LKQYDLSAGSPAGIDASAVEVGSQQGAIYYGLQLGPDGRIYLAEETIDSLGYFQVGIGVIHAPQLKGKACGYVDGQYFLGSIEAESFTAFPNYEASLFDATAITLLPSCGDRRVQFRVAAQAGITAIDWDFGDPASGAANHATALSIEHTYSQAGAYTVKATLHYPNGSSQQRSWLVTVQDRPWLNYRGDTTLCAGQTLLLETPANLSVGCWQDGSRASRYLVSQPGTYWVKPARTAAQYGTACGCLTRHRWIC